MNTLKHLILGFETPKLFFPCILCSAVGNDALQSARHTGRQFLTLSHLSEFRARATGWLSFFDSPKSSNLLDSLHGSGYWSSFLVSVHLILTGPLCLWWFACNLITKHQRCLLSPALLLKTKN